MGTVTGSDSAPAGAYIKETSDKMECPKDLSEWVNSDPTIVFFLYDID